jgi:hypothetical protein
VSVWLSSPSMPERSSCNCSGDFSSADADDKSSPNTHTVSKNLGTLTLPALIDCELTLKGDYGIFT